MDKVYFLWLQKIASLSDKFNAKVYDKIKQCIKNIYYNDYKDTDELKEIGISDSIINIILDKNIKDEIVVLYNIIIDKGYHIITIEDEEYPRILLTKEFEIPFIYITNLKLNLNNKNIYLYYNDYYTKYAKNLIEYFGKIIHENKCNVFTEYNSKKVKKVEIISGDIFSNFFWFSSNNIILPNYKYLNNFKFNIINSLVIIEAKYEEKIVKIVDEFIENNKDIYVVPSNIFNKNCYFSNYLIKQGADIILNKWDLKFILSSIIS